MADLLATHPCPDRLKNGTGCLVVPCFAVLEMYFENENRKSIEEMTITKS